MTRFFDVHFHAMNLSHPNILAFISRFNLKLLILSGTLLGPLITFLAGNKIRRTLNLLAVMENDIANFFLLLEHSLKYWPSKAGDSPPAKNGKLEIGKFTYESIVLTPLMMDFGSKNISAASYYRFPPQKPIAEQVIDLFNGIARYTYMELREDAPGDLRVKERVSPPLFEIYPFLGLNTRNYTLEEVDRLLTKYFSEYRGSIDDFKERMGAFNGDISSMGSNFFAGIKVYPPLGFDPWPEKEPEELAKIVHLYEFACNKCLPITSHASDGGFITVKDSEYRTHPERWREVLRRFPHLKLNLSHLGFQNKRILGVFPKKAWQEEVFSLIGEYENVFTDFSCLAFDDAFYRDLRDMLDDGPPILKKRLLFGSDFMINLLWVESYNDYLSLFLKTNYLTDEERHQFASLNAFSFLSGSGAPS